jgi:hypothetical protein
MQNDVGLHLQSGLLCLEIQFLLQATSHCVQNLSCSAKMTIYRISQHISKASLHNFSGQGFAIMDIWVP